MSSSTPRRAVVDDQVAPVGRGGALSTLRLVVTDVLLWTLGGLGLLSMLAAVAAHVWGFSIILFSTGSMAPTIPAGSAALVQLLPAGELEVGDITTIERPGQLPITHRITSVTTLPGMPDARVVTMRGDANTTDDAEPYVITDARRVVASVPGVAAAFNNLRDPRLMGVLTLLAGGLVTWAFWPRGARRASAAVAAAVVLAAPVLGSTEAQAVESEQQILGEHLVLTVISDEAAMAAMRPGEPVFWQVGVTTRGNEEGAVHVGLGLAAGSVNAEGLTVDVAACPERWQAGECSVPAQEWVTGEPADLAFLPATLDGTRELGVTEAGVPLWVLVRATVNRPDVDVRANLRLAAWGAGEIVDAVSDGDGDGKGSDLAYTGVDGIPQTLALAGVAIGTGLVVARLAGGRRRDTGREVAQ